MRSLGYSLNSAVADLIDNSITANARNVSIDLEPTQASYIAILDDGNGMDAPTAIEALRFAGSVGTRSATDLGRFGLGLKTASLSQGRALSLVTKHNGVISAYRWDIDHVQQTGRWSLIQLEESEISVLPWVDRLAAQSAGTLIVWQKLDLLLGDTSNPGEYLSHLVDPLMNSLALVFHRFLHGSKDGLQININGHKLAGSDPFLASNPATQISPTQHVNIGGAQVPVTAYTLPHTSRLTRQERARPDLSSSMREAQGFYIYRNKRLISHGHWFGLTRIDDLSKQTRVLVDVPNTIDHLWQLDIKKSRVDPPPSFKAELRRIMGPVIEKGRRVYTYRGRKSVPDGDTSHLWDKISDRDGIRYEVNFDNPLVDITLQSLPPEAQGPMKHLLRAIGSGYPTEDLYLERSSNQLVTPAATTREQALVHLRAFRESGVFGEAQAKVRAVLSSAEPFKGLPDLAQLIEIVWMEPTDGA